jgi:hypothetical protein
MKNNIRFKLQVSQDLKKRLMQKDFVYLRIAASKFIHLTPDRSIDQAQKLLIR